MTILTTHYSYLSKLENTGKFRNYKIPISRDKDGNIKYLYELKPGVSNQFIALELLNKKGFDSEIVKEAEYVCSQIQKNTKQGVIRSLPRIKKLKKKSKSQNSQNKLDTKSKSNKLDTNNLNSNKLETKLENNKLDTKIENDKLDTKFKSKDSDTNKLDTKLENNKLDSESKSKELENNKLDTNIKLEETDIDSGISPEPSVESN
jgi:DNA mismatch repair ATPase MutS